MKLISALALRNSCRRPLIVLVTTGFFLIPVVNAEQVQDLPYGEALYHFFQDDYFTSLIKLKTAEQQQKLVHHQQSAKLLEGGISLSYGMDRRAEALFTDLLLRDDFDLGTLNEHQQNKAWFYLGKLIYQHKKYPRAIGMLERIKPALVDGVNNSEQQDSLQVESKYLQAIMQVASGNMDNALLAMVAVPSTSIYWPYYYFNAGSHYAALGQWAKSIEYFEKINELMAGTTTEPALRDKANTAAGFAYIAQENYAEAAIAFQRVTLNSPVADKALLGYGLAESERERYQQALAPWQALRKQSLLLPTVQEVLLALPYAYEKLGALTAALSEYELATRLYQQEIAKLDQAINTFAKAPLQELFSLTGLNQHWLSKQELPPLDAKTLYITHLISKHAFQAELRDYYDLTVLAENLTALEITLSNLDAVDEEQNKYWSLLLDQGKFEQLKNKKQKLIEQLSSMQERLAHAKNTADPRLVEQGSGFELSQLINRAKKRLNNLQSQQQDVSVEAGLLQRFENLLVWQSNERYADNVWMLESNINDVHQALTQTDDAIKQLSTLVLEKNKPAVTHRITAMQGRISQQRQAVSATLESKDQVVRQLAIQELTAQKQQLQVYLARSTLSVARLYDLGSQQQEEDSLSETGNE